jgi:predicted protein tyrosine phosphatase
MKDIWVTSRARVHKDGRLHNATHVISLVDRGKKVFLPESVTKDNWLLLNFEDNMHENESGGPTKYHVKKILDWANKLPDGAVILIHCEAGISISTSAALAIMLQDRKKKTGEYQLAECYKLLLEKRSIAFPNPIICKYADEILGLNGELEKIGADAWDTKKELEW